MNIEQIIERKNELNKQLQFALSTMEKKDTIKNIYRAIKENQECCPHDIHFSLNENNECIYCGKKRGDN